MFMAVFFNVINGYINGRYLGVFAGRYGTEWFGDPRFIAGAALFVAGFVVNFHSDHILRKLRKGEETGYRIPEGGFFSLVTGANYFGEIVEWFGWACMTWSLPGLAFAFWAACNLIPRARSHHRWYLEKFPDYPKRRRVIFPYLY
jgi:steroid 5-alpha reductase family enzyme